MSGFDASGRGSRESAVRFGRFVLLPQRALYRNGEPVAVGGRALDLLTSIVLARGEVVSANSLMEAAWAGRVVVENALHQHIRALRKALGEDAALIQTVSGRGYRLLASVESHVEGASSVGRPARPPRMTTPILGREQELLGLATRIAEQRCVTVVGAAGIGKTRLVAEFAMRRVAAGSEVAWCDLSALEGADRLPAAVARGLGLPESMLDPVGGTCEAALGDRDLLLVLNNCEQVAAACATLVTNLLERCGGLRVLATSQRPLGLSLECRLMLGPLPLPAEAHGTADLEAYAAVQLLMQRAEAFGAGARPTAEQPVAAALVRRLEGNPLGIELAAARVATLGWEPTLQSLADHFRLLSGVGHAALPRHRSLDAAIAWGCELLTEDQRRVWRSLAIFRGGWTLAAARAVVGDLLPGPAAAAVAMAELVEHSMIERDPEAATPRFRMHEAYRCHARALSGPGPDWQQLARLHALHVVSWLESVQADWDTTPDEEWISRTGPELENLNAALSWALEVGDAALASRLASAGFPLWKSRDLLPSVLSVTRHPLLLERVHAEAEDAVDARLQLVHAMALLGESSDAAALSSAAHAALRSSDRWLDETCRVHARLCLASLHARTGQPEAQSRVLSEATMLMGRRRKGRTYGWLCIARAWELQLRGQLEAALEAVLMARVAWGAIGAWLDEGRAMVHAADLRLSLGDASTAIATGREAVSWFEGRLHRADQGRAMVNLGAASAVKGDYPQAREFLCSGVQALRGHDFTYWAFDHLAALAAANGEIRWAARWIGYADAGYARHRAGRRLVNEARAHDAAMEILSVRLSPEELSELMQQGASADEEDMLISVSALDLQNRQWAGSASEG